MIERAFLTCGVLYWAPALILCQYSIAPVTTDLIDHKWPAINNAGDMVWSQRDGAGYWQVFKQGPSTGNGRVQMTFDARNHERPVISDDGTIVWFQDSTGGGVGWAVVRCGPNCLPSGATSTIEFSSRNSQTGDHRDAGRNFGISSNSTTISYYDFCCTSSVRRFNVSAVGQLSGNFLGLDYPDINNNLLFVYSDNVVVWRSHATVPSSPALVDNGKFPRVADGLNPEIVYIKNGQITSKLGAASAVTVAPGVWADVNNSRTIVFEQLVAGKSQILLATLQSQNYNLQLHSGHHPVQLSRLGQPLADDFFVKVTDQAGTSVSGILVSFSISQVPPGATGTTLSQPQVMTQSDGTAGTRLTVGSVLGTYYVSATCSNCTPASVTFKSIAPGISVRSGNEQTGSVRNPLGSPLELTALDQDGNPSSSIQVAFSVAQQPSGAAGSSFGSPIATSQGGVATTHFTLGDKPGIYELRARCSTACGPNDSATFKVAASCVQIMSGNPPYLTWKQTASSGFRWARDQYDHSHQTINLPDAGPISSDNFVHLYVGQWPPISVDLAPCGNTRRCLVTALSNVARVQGIPMTVVEREQKVHVYFNGCMSRSCRAGDGVLRLTRVGLGATEILLRKTISNVGCLLTSLSMALQAAAAYTITLSDNSVQVIDPGVLNLFISNTLPVRVHGSDMLSPEADLRNENVNNTVNAIGLNIRKNLIFDELWAARSDRDDPGSRRVLDDNLCAVEPVPVIVGVPSSSAPTLPLGAAPGHFVLVTGKEVDPLGLPNNGRYRISDPAITGGDVYLDRYSAFQVKGVVRDPADKSKVYVTISEGGEVLVVDSRGRRTGFNRASGEVLHEIPGSAYASETLRDAETGEQVSGIHRSLSMTSPGQGSFRVVITGVVVGRYSLRVAGYNTDGDANGVQTLTGSSAPGSTATVIVSYSPGVGGRTTVEPIPGDLNGDGVVRCDDLGIVRASFGKRSGQAGFDPRADTNFDGLVDVRDLALVAQRLPAGTQCP